MKLPAGVTDGGSDRKGNDIYLYKGHTIIIRRDEDYSNPRTDWVNAGTMVCFHRRYNLGDKHDYSTPQEFQEDITDDNAIILPLFLYDHSGITMSTGSFACSWDSGQVGRIFMTYETIKKEYGYDKDTMTEEQRKHIYDILRGEVETYDQFLTGEVYGYTTDTDGSCWGFFGHDHVESGLLENAMDDINYHVRKTISDHLTQLKTWIKNKVPMQYRTPMPEL